MIVKCVAKFGKDLPLDCLITHDGFDIDHKFHLIVDKHYVVYAMTVYGGYIWYHICDEAYSYFPRWNPSPLFEVANGHLSRFWVYNFTKDGNWVKVIISYPEWANDPYYFDQLTDGEEKEVEIFKKYKSLMDVEFPNPSIREAATVLDPTWLLCPLCIDAWESIAKEGMVICPYCHHMLHNPKYENTIGLHP